MGFLSEEMEKALKANGNQIKRQVKTNIQTTSSTRFIKNRTIKEQQTQASEQPKEQQQTAEKAGSCRTQVRIKYVPQINKYFFMNFQYISRQS